MSDLRSFLIKASMDPDFRERFRTDPDAALAPYSLTAEERAALQNPEASLPLIARQTAEIRPDDSATDDAPERAPSQSTHAAFFLRIFPEVTAGADGNVYVTHSGVLDPAALAEARPIPWSHRLTLPETRAAADAVLEAPAGERRARILALIHTLVHP